MVVMRKRVSPATQSFWAGLERDPDRVPGVLAELARGHVAVHCTRPEADAALRWARSRPRWREESPGVAIDEE
jgi:hypothetical protein